MASVTTVRQSKCCDCLYQKPGASHYQQQSQHEEQMIKSSKNMLSMPRARYEPATFVLDAFFRYEKRGRIRTQYSCVHASTD